MTQLTDHLFRRESGKMVSVLTHIFGTEHLQMAEDVVQDTLLQALQIWKLKGLPERPEAWLHRVARNKAIDILRRNKFSVQYDMTDGEQALLRSEYTMNAAMDRYWQADGMNDDLLRMMYACCHPDISEEGQISLILKTLCGFSVAEIARSFLTSEDTIAKRLYRTKEFFRQRKIRPEFPPAQEIKGRTNAVLKTIYLIFNEGHSSTHSETHIRKDLLDHAIYLCELLCNNPSTQLPEVFAAMALMLFHTARTESRTGDTGDIVLLAEQDRSKWDRPLIDRATWYLERSVGGDAVSTYHIEAAIAYEHCTAPSFEETNWERIWGYYNLLDMIYPTAMVMLNKLMVHYKIHGATSTLQLIETAPHKKDWEGSHLYHSLLGDIYAATDKERARASYEHAITLTLSAAEIKLLRKKVNNL